jgi:hypothetical protein
MRIDIRNFILLNVVDTCSIWNILSSTILTQKANDIGCRFTYTTFVKYECLYKPRKTANPNDIELQTRLKKNIGMGWISDYPISIEDLQDVEILTNRKNLSKGEIFSMIFAKKTRQAFMTDDQGARKLSESYIGLENTQTVPHLFGWLTYNGEILDSDKDKIIEQQNNLGGIIEKYMEMAYMKGLEFRLIDNK